MTNLFPVINVPDDSAQADEAMGTKFKFWFQHSDLGECLFKQARSGTGEDWSEKIAAELCQKLGLPHAKYELATWKDKFGTISPRMMPLRANLQHGNDILAGRISSYPAAAKFSVSQHTLNLVLAAISPSNVQLPLDWTPPENIETAVDAFVGYLLLDAWISNTDRHHENWGFVTFDRQIHLAPTYDHASSLGRELLDAKRQGFLDSHTVEKYVRKSRSALYTQVDDKKAMLTFDAFSAIAQRYPKPAIVWLGQLSRISSDDIRTLFAKVPQTRISQTAVQFARQMLEINQTRLLGLRETLL